MMQSAANAYGTTAKRTASPRELEADLLLKAAQRLQSIRDSWEASSGGLDEALIYNRKLWTILLTSVMNGDNPLPAEIRQNVANLGLHVINQTLSMTTNPRPEQLNSLITINRELAAGLLAQQR